MKLKRKILTISLLSVFIFVFAQNIVAEAIVDTEFEVVENTAELCTDGIDNDGDTLVDSSDSDCIAFVDNTDTTPADNGGSSRNRSGSSKKSVSNGEVLGASTDTESCSIINTYMREGQTNNVEQVTFLQSFLNTELGINLPTTGYFGTLTDVAVRTFQLKYREDILKPWSDIGLLPDENTSTGYVYKTTQYKINTILCPELELATPVLK